MATYTQEAAASPVLPCDHLSTQCHACQARQSTCNNGVAKSLGSPNSNRRSLRAQPGDMRSDSHHVKGCKSASLSACKSRPVSHTSPADAQHNKHGCCSHAGKHPRVQEEAALWAQGEPSCRSGRIFCLLRPLFAYLIVGVACEQSHVGPLIICELLLVFETKSASVTRLAHDADNYCLRPDTEKFSEPGEPSVGNGFDLFCPSC